MKKTAWILPTFAALSLLSALAIQIVFMPWKLNSDSAFAPILAAWQVKTGQIFPDGMCYSTSLMGITNLFMIPGYLISGGNLVAARISGIFLMHLLLFLLLCLVFRTDKKWDFVSPSIGLLLFTIPFIDSSATEQYIFEGAYISQVLWILVGFLAYRAFMKAEGLPKRVTLGVLVILVIIGANLFSYRNLLTAFLPLTLACLFWSFRTKAKTPALKNVLKEWLPVAIVSLVGAAMGYFAYLKLSGLYWPVTNQTALTLGAGLSFTKRLHTLINSLISIVGNAAEAPLLDIRGFGKLFCYVAAFLLYIGLPVFAVRNYHKFRKDSTRFLIAFTTISSACMILVVLATDLTGVGNDLSRYSLPIFANCLLLAAAVLGDAASGHLSVLARYAPALLIAFAVFSHGLYWKATWDDHLLLPDPHKMIAFFEENNLHRGYATYWYAHRFTALTDFDVTIANIRVDPDLIRPDYWLTNQSYYERDFGDGRCFLMLTDKELKTYAPDGLDGTVLRKPAEILRYNQFYILVYQENIGSEIRLSWTAESGWR
ncbi:MAG: hypothetical protein ACSW75_01475 [Lachnospiraceae bacterium]